MDRTLRYAASSMNALAQNARHVFAANYALSIYRSDAIYSFIPKNACSSLRVSVAIANGVIENEKAHGWIHDNNATFRASLREMATARYTFVILRDPYLRLASCFLDKFVDQEPIAANFCNLAGFPGRVRDLSFRDFVANLQPLLRHNEHWRPQVDFLVYKTYDDVFSFEDMPATAKSLKAKIGLELVDARPLLRHGTDQQEPIQDEVCVANRSLLDLLIWKRSGKRPQLKNFYNPALAQRVAALYADDLSAYRNLCGREPIF